MCSRLFLRAGPRPTYIRPSAADRGEYREAPRTIKPPPDVGSAVISKRAMAC